MASALREGVKAGAVVRSTGQVPREHGFAVIGQDYSSRERDIDE